MKPLLLVLPILLHARSPDVEAPPSVWSRLPPAREGEWLRQFPEEGQTFAEYRKSGPNRPAPGRRVLHLLPCLTRPPADGGMLRDVAKLLSAYFGAECRIGSPEPLPIDAFRMERRQYDVARVVSHLAKRIPDDALLLLAITDRDLFLGNLAHLFGWASQEKRCGVLSTFRLGARSDPALLRRRFFALAAHEGGHLLSLPHCVFYRCGMNGALTLEESDRRPFLLCPVCREKLCWSSGLDRKRRYRELAGVLDDLGLPDWAARENLALTTCE